jgi:hypothetical protein
MTQELVAKTGCVSIDHSNEHQLLLQCAKPCLDAGASERINILLQDNIDWRNLLRLASVHGVIPLMFRNLSAVCPERVPETTLTELHDYFHANAWHNLSLTGELLKLLDLFETHNVRAVALKGPVLASSLYHDIGLRQYVDIDILLYPRHLARARDLLLESGYQRRYLAEFETALLRFGHELLFVSADGSIKIDFKWRFASKWVSFPVDIESLWERLESVPLGGTAVVLQPAPDDLLLLLCGHAYRHLWCCLKWVSDIAAFLTVHGDTMDWERTLEHATRMGGRRILLLGLILAAELLDARAPASLLENARSDRAVCYLTNWIAQRFLSRTAGLTESQGLIQTVNFQFRARERLCDKFPAPLPFADYLGYRVHRYARHYIRHYLLPIVTPAAKR